MPIDFSQLVLMPCMNTFARAITIDPIASRPGQPPYDTRGVYSSIPFDVQTIEGTLVGDQKTTIGIRLQDFIGPPPLARDLVTVQGGFGLTTDRRYFIDDVRYDGQGGAVLTIRFITPTPVQDGDPMPVR
jgi:hypothetical protein